MIVNDTYKGKTTVLKAVPPVAAGIGVEIAWFICQRAGIDIPKDQLYQLSVVLLGGYYALINWIKNRKKR